MKKIQIALVSKEVLPVYYLVNELKPDMVYLVGTRETMLEMRNLENVLLARGMACHKRTTLADDMQDCYNVCRQIHKDNGDNCEYCYNLTCGTKIMAFAALICARGHKARALYTDTLYYIDLNSFERVKLHNLLDTPTIIALQGQKIKEKVVYKNNSERTQCAEDIRDFIRGHGKSFAPLSKYYKENKGIPDSYAKGRVTYTKQGKHITIEDDDVELLSIDCEDSRKLLFEGRWWETLVADAVARWAAERHYEVWTSVRFEPNVRDAKNKDKNEMDILVNIGNRLLFVECKSGFFDQNNIYKLASVNKSYGSYKSVGVIVRFSGQVPEELKEKAKENRVSILTAWHGLDKLGGQLDSIIEKRKA